jgi:putative peptidoglycan lipid II flippase
MEEERQIARSAGLVGFFTLISRILGLVRDAVVAACFSKQATDPFFVAFTIPNVLRQLLAEGALTVAFIPVFTEYREKQGEPAARAMFANMVGATLTVLTLVILAGVFFAPWVVKLFALGFGDEPAKFQLTVLLTRIMFFYLLGVGLTALAMGVLNTLRHFSAPALAPVVLNVVIITTVLLATRSMTYLGLPRVTALAFGVVFGGVAQIALQLPFLARRNMLPAPRFNFLNPGVVRVAKLMLPSIFGLAIYQVNIILSRQFASFLPEGSISYLYYAQRLIEFPMGIFAVAIATVAMPNLASYATAKNFEGMKSTYRYTLSVVFYIILPASAGLLALSWPLTAVLFQRGKFSSDMALQTAITLQGFLVGLWAGAGVRQTVPMFYALQDTKTPVKVACLTVLVYVSMALLLKEHLGTLGLALAVSSSSTVNFVSLLFLLRRRLGLLGLRQVGRTVGKSGIAACIAGGGAWLVARFGPWEQGGSAPLNYVILLSAVGCGILLYALACQMLKVPEQRELLQALARRRRK